MAPANPQAAGSGQHTWDGIERLSSFLSQHSLYHLSQMSAFDRAPAPARSFTFLGWRISLQRVRQQPEPCPQCGGRGMWRPPYARERVPCDLCTSAPISQASATTSASPADSDNKA